MTTVSLLQVNMTTKESWLQPHWQQNQNVSWTCPKDEVKNPVKKIIEDHWLKYSSTSPLFPHQPHVSQNSILHSKLSSTQWSLIWRHHFWRQPLWDILSSSQNIWFTEIWGFYILETRYYSENHPQEQVRSGPKNEVCNNPFLRHLRRVFQGLYVLSPFPTFFLSNSSAGKESTCNAGDPGLILGLGRSAGEGKGYPLQYSWAFLVAELVRNLPAMQETWVWSLGWEDALEKGKATHSSVLSCRIPWAV